MKIVDADQPLDDHEPAVSSRSGSQLVISAGVTLKSTIAKPIAIANAKISCAARELGRDLAVLALLLRRVVRRDRERAEADRERLAERDHAADHRQPEDAVPRHRPSRSVRHLAISPSGLRTASAQFDGPRIITPSRTAWPPIVASHDAVA